MNMGCIGIYGRWKAVCGVVRMGPIRRTEDRPIDSITGHRKNVCIADINKIHNMDIRWNNFVQAANICTTICNNI